MTVISCDVGVAYFSVHVVHNLSNVEKVTESWQRPAACVGSAESTVKRANCSARKRHTNTTKT